jgi:hypothetical protein
MRPAAARTVCLALVLATLAFALSYASVYGQYRPGMGIRGGMPGRPPGFPNNNIPPAPGMPGAPGGQFNGMPGGQFNGMPNGFNPNGQFTGMPGGFNPPGMPNSPFGPGFPGRMNETVWQCDKCKAVLGTGPVKPMMVSCPRCGVRFANGLTPGFSPVGPFGGTGMTPPGIPPAPGMPGNVPAPGLQPPQLPTEPPAGAEPPPPAPAAGEQPPEVPPLPADSTTSTVPTSSGGSSKGKVVAIIVAVGVILVGVLVLVGAALVVVFTQKKPAPRRRRTAYD